MLAEHQLGSLGWDDGRNQRWWRRSCGRPRLTPRTGRRRRRRADASDTERHVLLDADLAVLGSEPAAYAAYATGVRVEYGHLPDEGWRIGRGEVLRRLLERPRSTAVRRRGQWWERGPAPTSPPSWRRSLDVPRAGDQRTVRRRAPRRPVPGSVRGRGARLRQRGGCDDSTRAVTTAASTAASVSHGRPDGSAHSLACRWQAARPDAWLTGAVPELVHRCRSDPPDPGGDARDRASRTSAHIVKVEPGESAAAKVHRGAHLRHPDRGAVRARVGAVAGPEAAAAVPGVQVDLRDVPQSFNDGLPRHARPSDRPASSTAAHPRGGHGPSSSIPSDRVLLVRFEFPAVDGLGHTRRRAGAGRGRRGDAAPRARRGARADATSRSARTSGTAHAHRPVPRRPVGRPARPRATSSAPPRSSRAPTLTWEQLQRRARPRDALVDQPTKWPLRPDRGARTSRRAASPSCSRRSPRRRRAGRPDRRRRLSRRPARTQPVSRGTLTHERR